jgi:hypothetical protein
MKPVPVAFVIALTACAGRTPAQPNPAPEPPSRFAGVVGNYTLTIELDQACGFSASERVRVYEAVIVDEPWEAPAYRPIGVSGGGFTRMTTMGGLAAQASTFTLSWNNFDIPGCNNAERLSDSRQFVMCGEGQATVDGTTLSATLLGPAAITDGPSCTGSHRFAFVRHEGP